MNININYGCEIILGALIADSAALGLHWLYDTERIVDIAAKKGLVFLEPNKADYADTKGFFAHSNKHAGDSSGYGEVGVLILKHFAKHGKFNRMEYQVEYCAHFGSGGEYIGYIDTPTRVTLSTLAPLKPAEFPPTSGADDDQFAALATIPVLVANHQGSQQALMKTVETVVRITNNNDVAVAAAQCAASVLYDQLQGTATKLALQHALPFAGKKIRPLLEQALGYQTLDSVTVANKFGSACHVAEGLPLIFHIAQHASNYRSAIEANILAGGDSCGRAMILGAMMVTNHQDEAASIPLEWLSRYRQLIPVSDACAKLKQS